MIVIPAIDIKGGKVVRLTQGRAEDETFYSSSPLDMARKWASFGVEMIHIVDLDGALEGNLKNLELVREIAASVKPKIELGGGMRHELAIKMALDAGVDKVVIGTKAVDGDFMEKVVTKFRGRIVAALDAREGVVYTRGWIFRTKIKVGDLVKKFESSGVAAVNYTDISKDGMLAGPNIESLRKLLKSTSLDVVAAGGVSTIEDIRRLKALEADGLKGVIVGKALYEGRIDLGEAMKVCKGKG